MSTSSVPWTDDAFGPGEFYGGSEPEKTLSPYRVVVGDDVYDQSQFTANTTHRYHNFTSGIGAGKTVAGIMRVAANVQKWNPGETGMIITPTSLGIKNVIMPELSKWGLLDEWEYRGPQSESPGLHAPNGTRILLESADNDRKIERLRGPSIAWFWMDEAALIPEKAWRICIGRLRAGNYRNAFITTTPKGENWIHDKFHPESPDQLDSVNNVLGVPSYANPHLALDYRRDILSEYEGQFAAQEVRGEFVSMEGLVYPWFDADEHVVADSAGLSQITGVYYGVDWGFHPHPAAILAVAETKTGEQFVMAEHYETRNTVDDLAELIAGTSTEDGMYDRYGRGPVYCDPSEPSNIETFQRHGIDARKADNSKTPGIQHVTNQSSDLYVHESCQSLINEFGQYRYEDGGDEPIEKEDHALDSLRYALFTHEQQGSVNAGVAFG